MTFVNFAVENIFLEFFEGKTCAKRLFEGDIVE